ncbi:MAG: acyltransferase family protein [Arthrobacter sp.]|jgi:peptidoglycan/LPS O-acetylase OafA/YrhL|nr:acyltransferase family protein [Arthrobacter sp.]
MDARQIPAHRDLALDLARVFCVVVVVFVHLALVGVGRNADGSPSFAAPTEGTAWINPATWVAEIMPLFFVIGGFAARVGWASTVAKGGGAADFIRARLRRLARPALPLYTFLALGLGAATLLGVDPSLLAAVAVPVGSVLWFLGAFMLVQALAPWMIRLHERAPWITLWGLLAAALLTDVIRLVVGIWWLGLGRVRPEGFGVGDELFGLPNIAFVWLFCQQLGFAMKDGWFAARSRGQLVGLAVLGYAGVGAMVYFGDYSASMLSNQWPPTLPLAALGLAQAALLTLLHGPLARLMERRWAQGAVFLVGSRLMSIYLWHVPVIVALTGVQLLLPLPMPAPGSGAWWATRPLMLVLVLAVVWLISLATARLELSDVKGPARFPSRWSLPCAVVLFVLPSVAIALYGLDVSLGLAAVLCTAASLLLSATRASIPVRRPPARLWAG